MDPNPSETHQDSSSRSGLSQKPHPGSSSSQPNLTESPPTDPAGNESSKAYDDSHPLAPMDTTDAEPPKSSEMDFAISYSAPLSTTPECCSPMDLEAEAKDSEYTDSWPSPTVSPDQNLSPHASLISDLDIPPLPSLTWPDHGEILRNLPDDLYVMEPPPPAEKAIPLSCSFPTSPAAPSGMMAGLRNLGSTCYLNSVLQCLSHTALLVNGILSCNHPTPCDGIEGFCVLCAFRDHIELAMALPGQELSPDNIVNRLNYFSSAFQSYVQQDAHEFFLAFLDKLGRCFPNSPNREESSSHQHRNLVEEVFGGQLDNKLVCGKCGHTSESYEPLMDLSLEIGELNTLSSALDSYTKAERVDDSTCENCKEAGMREKRIVLHRTPSVAVIQLKRFKKVESVFQKIDSRVQFPVELDLQPYTVDHPTNETLLYDLYAVLVHSGFDLQSGHYFCFVRSSPDVWHRLDDSMVVRVLGNTVLSQEAYMMFYARSGTPWISTIVESIKSFHDPVGFSSRRSGERSSTVSSFVWSTKPTIPTIDEFFTRKLKRNLFKERTDVASSPSKDDGDTKESTDASPPKSPAAADLPSGTNPSTPPKRSKLDTDQVL